MFEIYTPVATVIAALIGSFGGAFIQRLNVHVNWLESVREKAYSEFIATFRNSMGSFQNWHTMEAVEQESQLKQIDLDLQCAAWRVELVCADDTRKCVADFVTMSIQDLRDIVHGTRSVLDISDLAKKETELTDFMRADIVKLRSRWLRDKLGRRRGKDTKGVAQQS